MSNTLIINNVDGGAGYAKKDFDEISTGCKRHEHFLDVFHLNKKVKDSLCFAPELQGHLISALEYKYDCQLVDTILDTAESMLRILSCVKNNDLDYWLSAEFESSHLNAKSDKELKQAARDSLKKRHEKHTGEHYGSLEIKAAGNNYLAKFSQTINHINI